VVAKDGSDVDEDGLFGHVPVDSYHHKQAPAEQESRKELQKLDPEAGCRNKAQRKEEALQDVPRVLGVDLLDLDALVKVDQGRDYIVCAHDDSEKA